jgi:hypothetical protein
MIGLIVFLIFFLAFILPLMVLIGVAIDYVFLSYALYRVAKQTNSAHHTRAWIPVVRYGLLGECVEAIDEQSGVVSGKKPWKWGKILLILRASHLGAIIFLMPIAFLLALCGVGILLEAISWLSIVVTVAMAVCAFKIFRYYLDDPYDIIVSVLTVLYPGWLITALFIVSLLPPRGQKASAPKADLAQCDDAAVMVAQEPDEG